MVHGMGWWGVTVAAALLGVAAGAAWAEPYWIAYEANDFPEEAGWHRHCGNEYGPYVGGAERSLAAGVFTLNSLRHSQIFDYYDIHRQLGPAPGELFVAEWRVLVDPASDPQDAGFLIARDSPPGHVSFENGPQGLRIKPGNVVIPLAPGRFHSFAVYSTDMETFDLLIDGEPVYSGSFNSNSLLQSYVAFGDGVQGARSLTHWDYVRFGVVPEPGAAMLMLTCAAFPRGKEA